MSAPAADSCLVRHEFLIRRLHSLSGLIPVGAFMCVHLLTNATVLGGNEFFGEQVERIHLLGPFLPVVEWLFIFLPMLFHGVVGVVIIRGGLSNTGAYPYAKNIRYTLQRVTGIIAFIFIMLHVAHMHHLGEFLGEGFAQFVPTRERAAVSASEALSGVWIPIGYAIGILASVYHLANGLWTMGITWGVWTSPAAQRRADYLCGAFGVGLACIGLSALIGMTQARHVSPAKPEQPTALTAAHDWPPTGESSPAAPDPQE